jgi:hypothetical protein
MDLTNACKDLFLAYEEIKIQVSLSVLLLKLVNIVYTR